MGREIGYCGTCGIRVQAAEDQGFLLEGRLYCTRCVPLGPYDPRPLPEARPVTPRPLPRVRESTKRTPPRKRSALIGVAALLAVVLGAAVWAASGGQPPVTKSYREEFRQPAKTYREGFRLPEVEVVHPRIEEEAQSIHLEFEETALGLAGEGRIEGALRKIDAFPPHLRESRAWRNLEALRRSLEARR